MQAELAVEAGEIGLAIGVQASVEPTCSSRAAQALRRERGGAELGQSSMD